MYKTPSARRRKRTFVPLNLVSILDMVFILNFFLLSSAQFIKIFEIGSDLPIYKFSADDNPKKKTLELKVIIDSSVVTLVNGVNREKFGSYDYRDKEKLVEMREMLDAVKDKYPDENAAIINSTKDVQYQDLVAIIDHIREIRHDSELKKLFNQIMFDGK